MSKFLKYLLHISKSWCAVMPAKGEKLPIRNTAVRSNSFIFFVFFWPDWCTIVQLWRKVIVGLLLRFRYTCTRFVVSRRKDEALGLVFAFRVLGFKFSSYCFCFLVEKLSAKIVPAKKNVWNMYVCTLRWKSRAALAWLTLDTLLFSPISLS